MNSYFIPQDDPTRQHVAIPPHFQSFHRPDLVAGFAYPGPHPPFQPYPLSYPLQATQYPAPFPPFMPQQFTPHARPLPPSLLSDPAFSPDPRSNLHFFSMNDREEIYPASLSDSLSDYAPTVADDESEVDHNYLPPRMRLLTNQDSNVVIPPIQHARSQSTPYVPATTPPPQNLGRSNSARVIPVPPPNPIPRSSTPGSYHRKSSREELPQHVPRSSPIHASASAAAQEYWQAPPPYSDSETDSSSSNPHTPSNSPPASTYRHLPRDPKRSPDTAPPLPEKHSPPNAQRSTLASSSSAHAVSQPRKDVPAPAPQQTSSVSSSVVRPPITPRNASAPELHPPPPPIDVPPRPSTVPIPAPPSETPSAPLRGRRKNSKNPSISTPPRDLDSIDELDESDPLGFAWHHDGPYEAIAKATGSGLIPGAGAPSQKPSKVRLSRQF